MKALFISQKDLVRHTAISGNLDFDRVIQYIEIAQDIHLQGLLGTNLYNKLQNDVINNTLTGHYDTLVKAYIKPTLAQYAMLEFLPFAPFTVNNKGIYKATSENADMPSKAELNTMIEATRDIAQHYATRMIDQLRNYPNRYPEYLVNIKDEMSPNRSADFGGWNI